MAGQLHRYWLTSLAALTTVTAFAATPTPQETIRARFAVGYPDIKVTSVGVTPWQNVYEVVTPEGIIYSDATGEYAMSGQIMATSSKENLTQARLSALTRIDYGSLPFADAIKVVRGNGSRKLAVFADPNCPYCRQLEEQLQGLTDITVYTFLFPLEDLHPGANQHALGIWCSPDRAAAWSDWMLRRTEPQPGSCNKDTLDKLYQLGLKLEVVGTPTLFFADGRRISGLIPPAQLEQELAKVSDR